MPITVRMSAWRDGKLMRQPALLTEIGLRDALLTVTDHDEEKVNFICQSLEETGACKLLDHEEDSHFMLEKILHA